MARLLLVLILFASGSPLFGLTETGDTVITTDRLNLRSCPGKEGCAVLLTLPRGAYLSVAERQGEWLHVTSLETNDTGWVNVEYTKAEAPPPSSPSAILKKGLISKLFVVVSVLGALIIMAFFGKKERPNSSQGGLLVLSGLSVIVGLVTLLNQFGPILTKLTSRWIDLQPLSFLWLVNSVGEEKVSYWGVLLFLGATTAAIALASPGANGGKLSFSQGVCTGFLALPVLTIAALLAGLAIYILSFVFKAIIFVLGILFIPLAWLIQHVIQPVLRFLAIPFVWLWDHFLREIVEFIAIPFVWLWKVMIQPLLALILKFILKPLAILVGGIVLALAGLFPFGVVGVIVLKSVENSFRGSFRPDDLFAQGIAAGFLLLDATMLASLNAIGALHTAPPLSLAIPAALQLVVFFRLLMPDEAAYAGEVRTAFRQKLFVYCKDSKLDLIATCVLIPLGIIAAFASEDN